MRILLVWVAITAALALQTTLARYVFGAASKVDLVLVVVAFAALTSGPVTGLFAGTIGGIAQDVLSGGIIGVGGLAKTLVGFAAGVIGMQFIVTQTLPRFVVFFVATLVQAACFIGLYAMIGPGFRTSYSAALWQAVANGVVGIVAFQLRDLIPGIAERRRLGGRALRIKRLRY